MRLTDVETELRAMRTVLMRGGVPPEGLLALELAAEIVARAACPHRGHGSCGRQNPCRQKLESERADRGLEIHTMTIYELFDETEEDRVYTCGLFQRLNEALAFADVEPSEEALGMGCLHYTIRLREIGRFEHGVTGDPVAEVVWTYDYDRDVWSKTERSQE